MHKFVLLLLYIVLITGCVLDKTGHRSRPVHTGVTQEGVFVVSVNNGSPQHLLKEGIAYRPVLSDDGQLLAVEVMLTSSITIVKLFDRRGDRFSEHPVNVTKYAWENLKNKKELDLSSPKTLFSSWSENGSSVNLVLEYFDNTISDYISTEVNVPLK